MLRGSRTSYVAVWSLLAIVVAGCSSFPAMRDRIAVNRQTTPLADAANETNAATSTANSVAPSDPTADLWAHIRQRLQLHSIQHPRITEEIRWFKDNPQFLTNTSRRAEPFLFYIVNELERRNLPIELAFVPIVESAFQAQANSPSQASGIWQFIPGTGSRFGLRQDWWYDERRDFIKATVAALDYLTALRDRFNGDWLLAIAAYNNGEGNIERALQRNDSKHLPQDFWSISVRRETADYVPRILAVAQIVAHPELYGQNLQPIPNRPYFAVVDTGRPIDLKQLERGAGIDPELFQALNANYRRNSAGPNGPFALYVPVAAEQQVRETVAALPRHSRADWQQYQIRPGDTLSSIAARFGTTVATLQAANKMTNAALRAGQQILIPPNGQEVASTATEEHVASPAVVAAPATKPSVHVVAAGETLTAIAKQHGVSVAELLRNNGLTDGSALRVGQQLDIHAESAPSAAKPSERPVSVTYEVRSGDSLWRISNRFSVTVADLQRWNSLSPEQSLRQGQKLTVYPPRKS